MKLCRTLFSALLEREGLLYKILTENFSANSRTLYDDIINNSLEEKFKNYIYNQVDMENHEIEEVEERTPYEILSSVGYDLKECESEEEIQEFKKYYKPNEELCTFRGGRLESCVVFFAVRKDVDKIKRENFEKPRREDEYGTSVMSIQFSKKGICTVSIKNRYNHKVNNPDSTYGNDLNKIAPGLEKSFEELLNQKGLKLNVKNKEEFEIPGYVVANDGKYYKYNIEIDGNYYCPGNIIIENGNVHKLENPEKEILIDCFILDISNKTIRPALKEIEDSFTDGLQEIEKIEIKKNKEKDTKVIIIRKKNEEEPIIIEVDKDNQIIRYENKSLRQIGNCFLDSNNVLKELELPNLEKVGDSFLYYNSNLTELNLPNLKEVGSCFLSYNKDLKELELPSLKHIGDYFLSGNEVLTELILPNLEKAGDNFLYNNQVLTELKLPNLKKVGDNFLYINQVLTELKLPSLEKVGNSFVGLNSDLKELELPKLKEVGGNFLTYNKSLTELYLPNLKQVGNSFLYMNESLTELKLPNLENVGEDFLECNSHLSKQKFKNIHADISETSEENGGLQNTSIWMNRFSKWHNILGQIPLKAKKAFFKLKADIVESIRKEMQGTNEKEKNERKEFDEK